MEDLVTLPGVIERPQTSSSTRCLTWSTVSRWTRTCNRSPRHAPGVRLPRRWLPRRTCSRFSPTNSGKTSTKSGLTLWARNLHRCNPKCVGCPMSDIRSYEQLQSAGSGWDKQGTRHAGPALSCERGCRAASARASSPDASVANPDSSNAISLRGMKSEYIYSDMTRKTPANSSDLVRTFPANYLVHMRNQAS